MASGYIATFRVIWASNFQLAFPQWQRDSFRVQAYHGFEWDSDSCCAPHDHLRKFAIPEFTRSTLLDLNNNSLCVLYRIHCRHTITTFCPNNDCILGGLVERAFQKLEIIEVNFACLFHTSSRESKNR
jgi:hypothetical protein